jgi:hypothetical protein
LFSIDLRLWADKGESIVAAICDILRHGALLGRDESPCNRNRLEILAFADHIHLRAEAPRTQPERPFNFPGALPVGERKAAAREGGCAMFQENHQFES